MSPNSQLAAFIAFSTLALLGGYLTRRRGWLHEDVSRVIHLHTIIWLWTSSFIFSVWKLPVGLSAVWLVVAEIALVAGVGLATIPLARLIGCDGRQTGVMAVAGGVANIGITLGAFLCYCIIEPQGQARAYAMTMTAVMQIAAILVMYPVCRHYGELTDRKVSTLKLIGLTFTDVRSLPLLGTALGLGLAIGGAPFPQVVDDYYIVTGLFFLGCFSTYFGIGMRLRFGDARQFLPHHVTLAAVRFVVAPLVVYVIVLLSAWTVLPIEGTLKQVLLVQSTMPTAVMTVMLANLFHLDVRLACVLWLCNTVAFLVLVMPILLFVVG